MAKKTKNRIRKTQLCHSNKESQLAKENKQIKKSKAMKMNNISNQQKQKHSSTEGVQKVQTYKYTIDSYWKRNNNNGLVKTRKSSGSKESL